MATKADGSVNAARRRRAEPEKLEEMSFLAHLDALRSTLVHSAIVVVGAMIVCWFFSERILHILIRDLPVESLYFTSPIEAFMARLKVSAVLGVMIAFPFVAYRIWAFVAPGLFSHERKRLYPLAVASSALFYTGALFCYVILIPFVLQFLLSFGTERLNPLLSVTSYFAFVARLSFTFGVVFQLPIIVLILSAMGLVTPRWLLQQWRYGVVVIFLGSAVLTPPDAISLLLMAFPVLVLYLVSILVALIVVRRKDGNDSGKLPSKH